MSVSFQFQQEDIANPIAKQEALEVVASTARLSWSADATGGAFWRAASAGRSGSGLTGLFHRGATASLATSTDASLSSANVVFFVSKTARFMPARTGYAMVPAFEFMLAGKVYLATTGTAGQGLSSDRKATTLELKQELGVARLTNHLLSVPHRHAPTGAADVAPPMAPAPMAAVRMPPGIAVGPAMFGRGRRDSFDEPNYDQTNDAPAEEEYQTA